MQCRLTSFCDTPESCQSSLAIPVNLRCNSTTFEEVQEITFVLRRPQRGDHNSEESPAQPPQPESACVTNVEGSVIGELLRTVLCRR